MLVWMQLESHHKGRSLICLTALKTLPGIKGVVHMKGKLHGYFSSCKHRALLTAFMLLSLKLYRKQGPSNLNQTRMVLHCYGRAVKLQRQAESFKKILNCSNLFTAF